MHEHADNFENSYKKMKFSKLRYGKFLKHHAVVAA